MTASPASDWSRDISGRKFLIFEIQCSISSQKYLIYLHPKKACKLVSFSSLHCGLKLVVSETPLSQSRLPIGQRISQISPQTATSDLWVQNLHTISKTLKTNLKHSHVFHTFYTVFSGSFSGRVEVVYGLFFQVVWRLFMVFFRSCRGCVWSFSGRVYVVYGLFQVVSRLCMVFFRSSRGCVWSFPGRVEIVHGHFQVV